MMRCSMKENLLTICVQDFGKGILDIKKAREPFYTTKPELERSGMGFAFMETFMDSCGCDVGSGSPVRRLR